MTCEELGHDPDQQHRQDVQRDEHQREPLAPLGDARHGPADEAKQHGEPYRHQPPVHPYGEQHAGDHDQRGIAGFDFALAAPDWLPQQEQPEVREQKCARPPLAYIPGKRRVQCEQHQRKPPVRMRGDHAAVGCGQHRHHCSLAPRGGRPEGLSLYSGFMSARLP
jgi:hypothetical protein